MNLTRRILTHSQADPNGKLVLIAIADAATDHDEASMHVRDIMRATSLTRRGVQRIIRRLEELGELLVVHAESGNARSLYVILVSQKQKPGRANETPAPAGRRDFLAPHGPLVHPDTPKQPPTLHAVNHGLNGRDGAA